MKQLYFIFLLLLASSVFAAKKPAKMAAAPKIAPGQPEIFSLEPRGVQRGVVATIKLTGTNLIGLTELRLQNTNIHGTLLEQPEPATNEVWIQITADTNLLRGGYELWVRNTNQESSKVKLYVDDLPQIYEPFPDGSRRREEAPNGIGQKAPPPHVGYVAPFGFWGTLSLPGKPHEIEIEAHAGESLVLDVSAKSIGSKANTLLTLFDEKGGLLGSDNGWDGGDPLLNFQVPKSGRYRIQIADKTDSGSKDHFYRLSVGSFPVVTGCFPLGIPANKDSDVQLIGFNLGSNSTVHLKAGPAGEMQVPLGAENLRSRGMLKVAVSDQPELIETEPNDTPAQAMPVPVPCSVNGRIWLKPKTGNTPRASPDSDVDLFKFHAAAGQNLVFETDAARRGSPVDTKIEVLDMDGRPVERLLLQAMRDSQITFKKIDSNNADDVRVENWQEMELNQLIYLQGEVCKILRLPQGPDSGFQFYSAGGKRLDYFDTSPIAHALDEPAYVVESHPAGSKPLPNGLPAFTLYYVNDDDGYRKLGSDSYLLFNPPKESDYLVRISDSRRFSGERFAYRLTVREAKPDFNVKLENSNPTLNAGSGKEFSVVADRRDGFDGDITVTITNIPAGFSVSTPIVIQAGHLDAKGTVNAADTAHSSESNSPVINVTATALIENRRVTKDVNSLGKIKVIERSKLSVALEPYDESQTNFPARDISDPPFEITIAPGQTIPAWLKVKRNGHDDLITFTVDNLPHGVIVDNIGLNGVLIPKGEDSRQIFLTAAKWVPDTDRLCFAKANQENIQTSLPVLLHVRRPPLRAAR
jgi:hypothetical protein